MKKCLYYCTGFIWQLLKKTLISCKPIKLFWKKNCKTWLTFDFGSWMILCIVIASFQQELGFLIQAYINLWYVDIDRSDDRFDSFVSGIWFCSSYQAHQTTDSDW